MTEKWRGLFVGGKGTNRLNIMMNGGQPKFLVTEKTAQILKRQGISLEGDGGNKGFIIRSEPAKSEIKKIDVR